MTNTTTFISTYKSTGHTHNTVVGKNDTASTRTVIVAMPLGRFFRRARNPGAQF
jgi:hypothetical protein